MESTITTAWQRILDDPAVRNLSYKVETNETGQSIVRWLLGHRQEPGAPAAAFAVEARKGVKVPDVGWISQRVFEK